MPNLNGILLIDKPSGISSNALLQKVRHHLDKPKAGHAGTLDPLCTGMLPICIGHATKINQFLLDKSKCYTATLQFGLQTDTEDIEGNITAQQDLSKTLICKKRIDETLQSFLGAQKQIPPQYSALKHQGKPMYTYARKGIQIDKPAREIYIYGLAIINFSQPYLTLSIHCSKGTYIRSLIRDIGERMIVGATMTQLRREWSEPFNEPQHISKTMIPLQICLSKPKEEIINQYLLPTDSAIQELPCITLNDEEAISLQFGQKISLPKNVLKSLTESTVCRVYHQSGQCLAIGEILEDQLKTKKLLTDFTPPQIKSSNNQSLSSTL